MFCSIVTINSVFGKITLEQIKDIKKDIQKIKSIYRKERGFIKSRWMKSDTILEVFCLQATDNSKQILTLYDSWKEFVKDCEIGGADFIEQYI